MIPCIPPLLRRRRLLLSALAALLLLPGSAGALSTDGPVQTQTLTLRAGWNAVWLQVDPLDRSPRAVFSNAPVDKVATYFPARTPVEFIQDPDALPFKQKGWSIWYAPHLPESAVTDLFAIPGSQAYLVHATAPATLNVTGTVLLKRYRWRADSFNFVGFPVDPVSPPTFAAWFAGSPSHQASGRPMLYTLDGNGHWQGVSRLTTTQIQPGTAYWVFCKGGSDYQGPLDVAVPRATQSTRLDYGDSAESITLRFRNTTGLPIGFSVAAGPAEAGPLSYQVTIPGEPAPVLLPLGAPVRLGPVAANSELNLRLKLDRAAITDPSGRVLLTVKDDVGGLLQIPVVGRLP